MAATNWSPEVLGSDAVMNGSNAEGFVAGIQSGSAVFWDRAGVMTALSGMPSNTYAIANDISGSKEVCGNFIAGDTRRAFWWSQLSGGEELPMPPNLFHSSSNAINDAGFVVGSAHDTEPQPAVSTSWIWTKTGGLQTLPKPSFFSAAKDINNTGLIAGWGRLKGFARGVTWPIFGPAQLLPTPPGSDNAMAVAVNDGGQIVGTTWTGKWNWRSNERAIVWDGALIHDLTTLFNQNSSWMLVSAADINNRGDIVGSGTFNGKATGYLLIRKP